MTKNNKECTEDRFLSDVKDHKMSIVKDDGVHRHIFFKNPGSLNYWFELITWPGTLCINGDCGSYVFSRLDDMFCFFRQKNYEQGLLINPHYWSEKLQAVDRISGFIEFDEDSFKERVKEHFDSFVESHHDIEEFDELWEEIKYDVLSYSGNEHEAYSAVNNFNYEIDGNVFKFTDFFDG